MLHGFHQSAEYGENHAKTKQAKKCAAQISQKRYTHAEPKAAMKTNVGSFDAMVRFLIGWSILFFGNHGLGWLCLLGLWPIATGAIEFCPLYCVLHVNTADWEAKYESRHSKDQDSLKR